MSDQDGFVRGLPKAELHLHIEGTLEPEMTFALARRNRISLPWSSASDLRSAYEHFTDLQSFLDIYYQGAAVLRTEEDFHDLMAAYLERAHADGVRHAEIFFDPQTHTGRGIPFSVFMDGFERARREAADRLGISTFLIMCFLRHLDESEAMATLDEAQPFRSMLVGVGLDSSELGHPPEKFARVFDRARSQGLRAVAHAAEEGPSSFITGALDVLGAERIDHGVRCEEDEAVLERLVAEGITLTMCPLSNVRLRVFDTLEHHNLRRLLDRGISVTINSDDPAYFGGYVGDNYIATSRALGLDRKDQERIARNSITGSFLDDRAKADLLGELDRYLAASS